MAFANEITSTMSTSSATVGAFDIALCLSAFAQCLLRVSIPCMTDTDDVALLELQVAVFVDFTFALLLKIRLRFRGSFLRFRGMAVGPTWPRRATASAAPRPASRAPRPAAGHQRRADCGSVRTRT